MKDVLRSPLVRLVFILAVAAAAYLLGWTRAQTWQLSTEAGEVTKNSPKKVKQVSTQLPQSPANNIPPDMQARMDEMRHDMALAQQILATPAQGLTELFALPPGPDTRAKYGEVFSMMVGENAAKAADLAFGLPAGPNRDAALQQVYRQWGQSNPQALLDWAAAGAAADPVPLRNAIIEIATYPDKTGLAASYLDKLGDASARDKAIDTIVKTMSATDPAGALDLLDKSVTGATYDRKVKDVITSIAKGDQTMITGDPVQAASLVEKITEPGVRSEVIAAVAAIWAGGNPEAEQSFRRLSSSGSSSQVWAAGDPKAALAWAQSLPEADASARTAAINAIVSQWSKTDPTSAFAVVQSSTDPAFFLSAAPALAQSLATADPQKALNWVNSLPEGAAKNDALSNAYISIARRDFSVAWNNATQMPEGSARDATLGGLVGLQAAKNPTQAAALIAQMPSGAGQINASNTLAATWALQNPGDFSQWLTALPSGEQRTAALTAALAAVKSAKLPEPQRASLIQKISSAPAH